MMALDRRPRRETSGGERSSGAVPAIPIQGSLSEWPLSELLQFLQRTRQTGELALERGEPAQAASLSVHQGRLVDGRCPPLIGDEAVLALLAWQHGRFLFLAGPVPSAPRVQAELRTLLLEGARRRDELERALALLPPADTVLHPIHESATSGVSLSRLAWNLLSHVDGTRTVADLVEGTVGAEVELAEALVDLLRAGVVATAPDTAFLAEIAVRRLVDPGGAGGIVDALLAHAAVEITLAELVAALDCPEEEVLRCIPPLVEAHWLEVCEGQLAYLRHLHQPIAPRL